MNDNIIPFPHLGDQEQSDEDEFDYYCSEHRCDICHQLMGPMLNRKTGKPITDKDGNIKYDMGNNPWPILELPARCCRSCNVMYVEPARGGARFFDFGDASFERWCEAEERDPNESRLLVLNNLIEMNAIMLQVIAEGLPKFTVGLPEEF